MTMLLQMEGLALSRTGGGRENLVDGITLSVGAGETLGIIGESGSGKTLVSLACIGLLPPGIGISAGRILLDGQDIGAASPRAMRALRGRQVGMVFQEPLTALNPLMRIGAQLVEAVRVAARMSSAEAKARAIALLEQVRFPDPQRRFDDYPHQLSGGLRQRVAIAIAIAGQPRLLIADEPTTALDATVQQDVLDTIAALQRDLGFAMLLISHDIGVVAQRTDRIAVLYAGRIMESGPTRDVLRAPAHPYTQALLAAQPGRPRVEGRRERLAEIPGHVPHGADRPAGCSFQTRCGLRVPACDQAQLVQSGARWNNCVRQAVLS